MGYCYREVALPTPLQRWPGHGQPWLASQPLGRMPAPLCLPVCQPAVCEKVSVACSPARLAQRCCCVLLCSCYPAVSVPGVGWAPFGLSSVLQPFLEVGPVYPPTLLPLLPRDQFHLGVILFKKSVSAPKMWHLVEYTFYMSYFALPLSDYTGRIFPP